MSEITLLLKEIQELKRRLQALEATSEHPGFAASDVARLSVANTFAGVQTIPNTGLHILDTNGSHDLILAPGSNLTADRTLTLTTGDADRTITLSGNLTVPATGTAALATGISGGQTIYGGTAASDGLTLDSTSNGTKGTIVLQPSGGRVGIGATPASGTLLHISGAKNTAVLRLASTTSDSLWSNTDYIGAIEFYSADASNGGAGVVAGIKVLNDTATTGNRVGMLFTTRGTASGVTNNALYIDEVGNIGSFTLDPTYARIQIEGVSLGTTAAFAFTVIDGTYNPRAIISHVTSTTDHYVKFESAFSSGSGLADWVFSNGNVGIGVTSPTAYLHIKAGTASANTAPLKLTTGTVNTTAEAGSIEYNNTFHMTNSDATRRNVVLMAGTTKTTAAAPYANDGYITINVNGVDFKVMTTA